MYAILTCLSLLFRALPRRAAHALGAALGWLWYYLIPVRRGVARANLGSALPDRSSRDRARIARACFVQLARCAVEFLRLPGLTRARADALVEHQGFEHLEEALAAGQGAIVATAHFGNFDLLACVEALRGVPLHAITREQSAKGVNRFWMKVRKRAGVQFVPSKSSAFRIRKLLAKNQVVAMVIDQHMPPGRGIPVPFFGRPASTTHAPAIMALTTGAPIVPASIERLPAGRHRVVIEPAITWTPSGDRERDVASITESLNRWLEGRVRHLPDHWLWIHRRWKPLPDGARPPV